MKDDLSKGNLPGARITLIGTNGATIASTVTDSNGNYAFFDLPAGSYTVFEAPLTGFINLTPVDGKIPVTLSGGQNVTGQNFIDRRLTSSPTSSPTPAPTADPTPLPTARPTPVPTANPTISPTASPTSSPTQAPTPVPLSCISGNVGEDLFQGNVGPLAGVTVTLTSKKPGFVAQSTITDSNGNYAFCDLQAAKYNVTETLPAGYSYKSPKDGNILLSLSWLARTALIKTSLTSA